MLGRIKFVKPDQGFGFIVCDNGEEFFFHMTKYKDNWEELVALSPPTTLRGPEVQFKTVEHRKGPRAIDVELIKELEILE